MRLMPTRKRAGTSSAPNEAPLAARVAEIPNSAISVAVSKPRPNRSPIRNRRQLFVTILKIGRKNRARRPRLLSRMSKSFSQNGSPRLHRSKRAPD
jgi:hypothetical protein